MVRPIWEGQPAGVALMPTDYTPSKIVLKGRCGDRGGDALPFLFGFVLPSFIHSGKLAT